jgi:hypothetical protein
MPCLNLPNMSSGQTQPNGTSGNETSDSSGGSNSPKNKNQMIKISGHGCQEVYADEERKKNENFLQACEIVLSDYIQKMERESSSNFL